MTTNHHLRRSSRATDRALLPKISRPSYRAARAFFITFLLVICLVAFASLRQQDPGSHNTQREILKRGDDTGTVRNEDEECRLVRSSPDQCAFVKKHCPTDEWEFAAMLDLYYCRLGNLKPLAFVILVSWLGLLFSTIGIAASDFFCINLSTIAAILGMSESMAGVTFLAFGNGSPDVFTTFAAMSTDSGSLAVGELFGAAGFITAVVAGSMALIRPFQVAKKSFIRDVGFFVVAAAFSMTFLSDGRLYFWECLAMVIYYIFYVGFVVCWHWWLGRRRRQREAEALIRGHFVNPGDELDVEYEEYHDDPEDRGHAQSASITEYENWPALEQGYDDRRSEVSNVDDEEQERERWMSELSSNMRLTRPARSRANTTNPVRPSLVGALEFQAVLKSLQKSRNIQTIPLSARRYSDDPVFTTAQQQENLSSNADPASRPPFQITISQDTSPTVERPNLDVPTNTGGRARAASASHVLEVPGSRLLPRPAPFLDGVPEQTDDLLHVPSAGNELAIHENAISGENGPALSSTSRSSQMHRRPSVNRSRSHSTAPSSPRPLIRSDTDRSLDEISMVPQARNLPKIIIPRGNHVRFSPLGSPMSTFRDSASPSGSRAPSIYLPEPHIEPLASPESVPVGRDLSESAAKPTRWWPYTILPAPSVLGSTLLPTFCLWSEKNWWEKLLAVVAAPSVFLLTITLPVVENEKQRDLNEQSPVHSAHPALASPKIQPQHSMKAPILQEASRDTPSIIIAETFGDDTSATPQERQNTDDSNGPQYLLTPDQCSTTDSAEWNRWLTVVQLYFAPPFTVLSIYSQSPSELSPTWLIRPILICLLVSTILLIPFLRTTTSTHRPAAYRTILSIAGFVVSIAWISMVASQVVGALKALAVILNMSHAIMGLTIFAVGNSLGDLVADVTVARLGYPVMALSACFGGPMLNILLGVGLSGCYIMLRGAQHRHKKHPHKDFKFKSYDIEVSNTLIVSGATLLLTLVGLLIIVPLNRWVMSKRIGWALIALWTLSTIGNVVLEVMGFGEQQGREG